MKIIAVCSSSKWVCKLSNQQKGGNWSRNIFLTLLLKLLCGTDVILYYTEFLMFAFNLILLYINFYLPSASNLALSCPCLTIASTSSLSEDNRELIVGCGFLLKPSAPCYIHHGWKIWRAWLRRAKKMKIHSMTRCPLAEFMSVEEIVFGYWNSC